MCALSNNVESPPVFRIPRSNPSSAPVPSTGDSPAGFDVSTTFRGESAFFRVYYDDALGPTIGGEVADGILAKCDVDYQVIKAIFGAVTPPLPMTVVVTTYNQAHGAYHHTCLDNVLYCTGETVAEITLCQALVVAEEVEVFSAAQGLGWDCLKTNGEGLSRVLAEELYPGVLDFAHTADAWLDSSRADYITDNHGNDQDSLSNGCSVLFLYYLRYILGYEWPTVIRIGGATLAETYARLTGNVGAYSAFRQCIDGYFPIGNRSGLTADNPFPVFDFYAVAGATM